MCSVLVGLFGCPITPVPVGLLVENVTVCLGSDSTSFENYRVEVTTRIPAGNASGISGKEITFASAMAASNIRDVQISYVGVWRKIPIGAGAVFFQGLIEPVDDLLVKESGTPNNLTNPNPDNHRLQQDPEES